MILGKKLEAILNPEKKQYIRKVPKDLKLVINNNNHVKDLEGIVKYLSEIN